MSCKSCKPKKSPVIFCDQPPRLSVDEMSRLLDLFNDLVKRCPTIATGLLLKRVLCSANELRSNYLPEFLPEEGRDFPVNKMPGRQLFAPQASDMGYVDMASVLTACVEGQHEVLVHFDEGVACFKLYLR